MSDDRVEHFRRDMNAIVEDLIAVRSSIAYHSALCMHMLSVLCTEIGQIHNALD